MSTTAPVLNAALTSPMGQLALGETLQGQQAIDADSPIEYTRDWRDLGLKMPSTVLLVLLGLMFLDSLLVIFTCINLAVSSSFGLAIMLLFPPFAQPISMMLGPLFVATEAPWCGRIYATLALFGAVSPVAAAVYLGFVLQIDSRVFDMLVMVVIVGFKVAIYLFTQLHIANLEALQDLGFADVCQADFLGVILSGTGGANSANGGGLSHMGAFGDDDLEEKGRARRISEEDCDVATTVPDTSNNSMQSRSFGPLPSFPRPSPPRSRQTGTNKAEASPF